MKRDDIDLQAEAMDRAIGALNNDAELIAHHEECLQAAIDDMERYYTPGKTIGGLYDGSQSDDWSWALQNAAKHYNALIRIRGWSLDETWRREHRAAFRELIDEAQG